MDLQDCKVRKLGPKDKKGEGSLRWVSGTGALSYSLDAEPADDEGSCENALPTTPYEANCA